MFLLRKGSRDKGCYDYHSWTQPTARWVRRSSVGIDRAIFAHFTFLDDPPPSWTTAASNAAAKIAKIRRSFIGRVFGSSNALPPFYGGGPGLLWSA